MGTEVVEKKLLQKLLGCVWHGTIFWPQTGCEMEAFCTTPFLIGLKSYLIQFRRHDNYVNATALCKQFGTTFSNYCAQTRKKFVTCRWQDMVYEDAVAMREMPYNAKGFLRLVAGRTGIPTGLKSEDDFDLAYKGPTVVKVERPRSKLVVAWVHPLAARHLGDWLQKSMEDQHAVRDVFDKLCLGDGLRYVGWAPPPSDAPCVQIRQGDRYLDFAKLARSCGVDYSLAFRDTFNEEFVTQCAEDVGVGTGIAATGHALLPSGAEPQCMVVGYGQRAVIHRPFWVHPTIATGLAAWCGEDAAIAVSNAYAETRVEAPAPVVDAIETILPAATEQPPSQQQSRHFIQALKTDDGKQLEIEIRPDGYVNVTKLLQVATTKFTAYINKHGNLALLEDLAKQLGMRVGAIRDSETGRVSLISHAKMSAPADDRSGSSAEKGSSSNVKNALIQQLDHLPVGQRGTWVHEMVAIDVAYNCFKRVRLAIINVIHRYTKGQVTTEESLAVARALGNAPLQSFTGKPHCDGPVLYFAEVRKHHFDHVELASKGNLPPSYSLGVFGKTEDLHERYHGTARYSELNFLDAVPALLPQKSEALFKTQMRKDGRLVVGRTAGQPKDTELFWFDGSQEGWNSIVRKGVAIAEECNSTILMLQGQRTLELELAIAKENNATAREKTTQMQLAVGSKRAHSDM